MSRNRHSVVSILRRLLPLLLVLLALRPAAQTREYQVKALFVYHFGQYVDWPAGSSAAGTPFVIGVVGNDPFGRFLDDLVREERLDGRPILVQHYASPGEIKNCNILFVGSGAREALAAVAGKPVLTVGESPDFIQAGGMIQFYTEQDRIRFIIRPSAAKAVKLTLSSKLLRLAKIAD